MNKLLSFSIYFLIFFFPSLTIPYQNLTLLEAIKNNNIQTVKNAISAGVNINEKYLYGYSPLMVAVINERLEIVKLLIEKGAAVNDVNTEGNTALDLSSNKEIIDILKSHGATQKSINKENLTKIDDLVEYIKRNQKQKSTNKEDLSAKKVTSPNKEDLKAKKVTSPNKEDLTTYKDSSGRKYLKGAIVTQTVKGELSLYLSSIKIDAYGQFIWIGEGEYPIGDKIAYSGKIESMSSSKIVINYRDKSNSFEIVDNTKICIGRILSKSFEKLIIGQNATVITAQDNQVALEIHDLPLEFYVGGMGQELIEFECK